MSDNKTYAVVQALNQAASNAFPGALDKKGEPREDLPIGKTNDGFKVSFIGREMLVKYQGEMTLEEIQDKSFDSDLKQKMADILKYIKKEYKSIKGGSVSLKKEGKTDILIQSLSRFRSWVQATDVYEIGSLDKDTEDPKEKLDESLKSFLLERKGRV